MKKMASMALSASLVMSLAFPAAAGAQSSFKDIDNDFWAKDSIDFLTGEGVVNGYKDNTFRPNAPVKRSQAALMLTEALDLDTSDRPDPGFSDIDKKDHAYEAAAAIADEGIITGKDGKFMPNKPLTRAQMAKILTVAYELDGEAAEEFADIDDDHWAYDYVNAIASHDIASGYEEDQTFRPNKPTTRAQFAKFLTKSIQNEDQPEEQPDDEIAELLKDTMEAQLNLDSYTFDGSMGMNMEIPLPEGLPAEDKAALENSMNIDMDVRGSYQKDPLLMETIVDMQIPNIEESITSASIMTEDNQYEYVSDAAFLGYPEEWQGKYIEYDYEEMFGEDFSQLFDVEQQMELTRELYDAFLDNFGTDAFELLDEHEAVPSDVEYEQIIKFELTEETLADFADTFEETLWPELENILENPQAISTFGLSAQEVNTLNDAAEADFDEFLENLSLDNFVVYQAVNADNNIVFDTADIEISYTDEASGTMSFGIDYALSMSNFNEDVEWEHGLPENEEDIIPFEEVLEWQQEQLEHMEDFDKVEEDSKELEEEADEDAA